MDRASRQVACGDLATAMRQCEHLVSIAPSRQRKIEALRLTLSAAVDVGDLERARRASLTARALCDELTSTDRAAPNFLEQACIDLMDSDLAYYSDDTKNALESALLAVAGLRQTSSDGASAARELYSEALF
jgi:hypothetical protein